MSSGSTAIQAASIRITASTHAARLRTRTLPTPATARLPRPSCCAARSGSPAPLRAHTHRPRLLSLNDPAPQQVGVQAARERHGGHRHARLLAGCYCIGFKLRAVTSSAPTGQADCLLVSVHVSTYLISGQDHPCALRRYGRCLRQPYMDAPGLPSSQSENQ